MDKRQGCGIKEKKRLFAEAAFLLILLTAVNIQAQDSYVSIMKKAQKARIGNNCTAAESLYTEILKKNPEDADALVGRGICRLRDKNRIEAAIRDFEKVIGIAPGYVDAYTGKASALVRTSKPDEAHHTLKICFEACKDDTVKMRYLAMACWKLRFYRLARRIDREYGKEINRLIIKRPNTVFFNFSWSRLVEDENWFNIGGAYVRKLRPDLTISADGIYFDRNYGSDFTAGAALAFNVSRFLTLSYKGEFSDTKGFVFEQKHKPKAVFLLFNSTTVGIGADLSRYSSGWVKSGRLELKHHFEKISLNYTLLGGQDNADNIFFSHIAEAGYTGNKRFKAGLGGASGHESVESYNAGYVKEPVYSLFAKAAAALNNETEIHLIVLGEWRDKKYFRTVFYLTPVLRF